MKIIFSLTVAGLAIALSATPALAFGRGGAVRGAAVGPRGGTATGGAARGVATGPYGGVHGGQVHGSTRTGPGGTTVQHVGGAGATVGPAGGVHAGAGGATKVTGPGGQSVTHAQGGRAGVGPGGTAYRTGGAGTVAQGYGGTAAVGHRGGVAVGPAGGVVAGGSRGGAVATPWGGAAASGYRGGVAFGPGGAYAAGTHVVGHTTGYMSPVVMRNSAVAVRTAGTYPYFNRTWYGTHTAAWVAPRYVAGVNPWAVAGWATLATFCAISAPPVSADYGSSVVINDSSVYVDGEAAGTPTEYAAQAATIADTGREAKPAESDEWQPLGVFGLVQPDDKVAQRIFQLAVNKDGVVRGNYYDAVGDTTTPVYGSVDKKTQRTAWSIGEKKEIVFETALPNLTKDESTVLIHYGKDRTDQQMLVRLPEPTDEKK